MKTHPTLLLTLLVLILLRISISCGEEILSKAGAKTSQELSSLLPECIEEQPPGKPPAQKPETVSYLPKKLKLYIGGPFGPSYRVEWKEDALVYQELDRADPILTKTVTPTPEKWKRFWKHMEEVKLWKWRDRYDNKGALDGTLWEVEIEQSGTKGKSKSSKGHNSYPCDGDVTKPLDSFQSSKVFKKYCAAVEELVGKQRFR